MKAVTSSAEERLFEVAAWLHLGTKTFIAAYGGGTTGHVVRQRARIAASPLIAA